MRSSPGGRGGSGNADDRMASVTLKFPDTGAEAAFVGRRTDQLLPNFRKCCLLVFLAGLASICLGLGEVPFEACHQPWGCGMEVPAAQRVRLEVFWIGTALILTAASVGATTKVTCLSSRLGPVGWEALIAAAAVFAMASQLLCHPAYWGQLRGHSLEDVVGVGQLAHSNTTLLLFIDLIITASHIFLPIRWFVLVPVQVSGVVLYALISLLLSNYDDWMQFTLFLATLTICASLGKRALERQERQSFRNFMAEKTLRLQTEFQLSQVAGGGHAPGSEDQHSASGSALSTTESGRVFIRDPAQASDADLQVGFLPAISELGQKEQWLIDAGQVRLQAHRVLGEGSFGQVVHGWYCGTPVAVKLPKARVCRQALSHLAELSNELGILRRLRHPNIVFLFGALLDSERGALAIVLELVDGASLRDFISPRKGAAGAGAAPTDVERAAILADISCALWYLHTRQPHIVHGDLKDTNAFVEPSRQARPCRAKLLDFGLSRAITKHAKPLGGTLIWMAPEVIRREVRVQSAAADIFSFGRLTFFVVTGVHPATLMTHRCILKHAKRGQLPMLRWPHDEGGLTQSCKEVVARCCQFEPSARPHIAEVHPRFSSWLASAGVSCFDCGEAAGAQDRTGVAQGPEDGAADAPGGRAGTPQQKAASPGDDRGSPAGARPAEEDCYVHWSVAGPRPAQLKLPRFARTPMLTQLVMLQDVAERWNIEVPQTSCCISHAEVSCLRKCCDTLQSLECSNHGGRGRKAGQCGMCGAIALDADINDDGAVMCRNCGEKVDAPAPRRRSSPKLVQM